MSALDDRRTTLHRDVRLTDRQLHFLIDCTRRRINELGRKISTAEANRAAGATIQHGTLDAHYRELSELNATKVIFEVALRQIGHQLAARVHHD